MAEDAILKLKISDDHTVQVGDMGKTVVRSMDGVASADDMELNFFYSRDCEGAEGAMLGEISNIRVEPKFTGDIGVGDAVVFGSNDLLN